MRSIAGLAATVALALSAVAPAGASDPGSCGGNYSAPRSCVFASNGLPIVFNGDAVNTGGQASVRVWITPDGYDPVVLLECTARAQGFTRCDGGFPDQSSGQDFLHQIPRLRLRCHVEGTADGTYGCRAGFSAP